ncbi:MAG: hypothetical protein H6822_04175 [Planctomycetaceae bacterium]|nr:hypothetical protein [Planctomycetales bacterium]MCB9921355.1 hypothetical protein [Planctomycetaceae bacterium]
MNKDSQISPREFSDSLQELRDEMRQGIGGLSNTIERIPKEKTGVSPLALAASGLVSLFVGATGMSIYDSRTQTPADAGAPETNVQAELQTVMVPYTEQLEQMTKALVAAQETATENSNTYRLLLDQLTESVGNLQKSAEVQNAAFHQRVDLLADELAAKVSRGPSDSGSPTTAARQPIPGGEDAGVQPANAEVEIAEQADSETAQPAAPAVNEPKVGELVINNPSEYDLNLLVNGEPLTIKSRGVTTIAVTQGEVKTQIANIPITAKSWNNWETVDGVARLTIHVESGDGYYKLR